MLDVVGCMLYDVCYMLYLQKNVKHRCNDEGQASLIIFHKTHPRFHKQVLTNYIICSAILNIN